VQHCDDIAGDFPDAKWLYADPDSEEWERLREKGGFDIADWVNDYKVDSKDIMAAISGRRSSPDENLEQPNRPAQAGNSEDKPCTLARQFQEVKELLGDQLRLNTLRKQIELNGEVLNPDRVSLKLANDFNLPISRANALDIVAELAEQNSYSPVVQYLNSVREKHGDSHSILEGIASRYFGTDKPIYDTYLRNTLIAAVARAMNPGCKVDTALILQGKQGIGKSTFFKTLAGEDWFSDSLGQASDKDELLKLHVAWFIEWAELESILKRRDLASVKGFLSAPTDYIRLPYGRSTQVLNRPSIIVGTTNEDELFNDPTGNRRFWVVPVQKPIDLERLRQERDSIWAAAVALHGAGCHWWLTPEDEELSSAIVSEYQVVDPWQEEIAAYVRTRTVITAGEVLDDCLDLDLERRERKHEMRVGSILKSLGWAQDRRYVEGKQKRVWVLIGQP
jgi:predicted P-loop ATPase